MPLVVADFWAVQEEPLARLVLHAGLGELDLDSIWMLLVACLRKRRRKLTIWMTNDLDDSGLASAADLTIETVTEIKTAAYKFPTPTLVTNAMGPEVLLVERGKGRCGITDEAACCVRVHAEQERDEQVVRVPKGLKRLLSDPSMGSGVDEQHAKQHDVSSDTTSFGVVDLESDLWSYLGNLNVVEVDVVGTSVEDREEEHGVGDLTMEPL